MTNLSVEMAESDGGLGRWDGLCLELADAVVREHPGAWILSVDLDAHPDWGWHAVPVVDGVVHDAWFPEAMLHPDRYVAETLGNFKPRNVMLER